MTSQLARDLAAIAHQHYVMPSTTDQGPSEALIERMQERLKAFEAESGRCHGCGKSVSYCEVCTHLLQT